MWKEPTSPYNSLKLLSCLPKIWTFSIALVLTSEIVQHPTTCGFHTVTNIFNFSSEYLWIRHIINANVVIYIYGKGERKVHLKWWIKPSLFVWFGRFFLGKSFLGRFSTTLYKCIQFTTAILDWQREQWWCECGLALWSHLTHRGGGQQNTHIQVCSHTFHQNMQRLHEVTSWNGWKCPLCWDEIFMFPRVWPL